MNTFLYIFLNNFLTFLFNKHLSLCVDSGGGVTPLPAGGRLRRNSAAATFAPVQVSPAVPILLPDIASHGVRMADIGGGGGSVDFFSLYPRDVWWNAIIIIFPQIDWYFVS
jgi:hypothetical protein